MIWFPECWKDRFWCWEVLAWDLLPEHHVSAIWWVGNERRRGAWGLSHNITREQVNAPVTWEFV